MSQTTFPPRSSRSTAPRMRQFCEAVLSLNRKPLRFPGRPYIDDIYRATEGNLVIRAGRQVEKSAYVSFRMAYEMVRHPGTTVLLVCPRDSQSMLLMKVCAHHNHPCMPC